MPTLPLATVFSSSPLLAEEPGHGTLAIPIRSSGASLDYPAYSWRRDAIIDTGSPLTWMPEAIWNRFQLGTDYEWLPWSSAFTPPLGRTAGWNFAFRMARFLQPISLFHLGTRTELTRDRLIAQFATGNPPASLYSNAPPRVVIGLWGGMLEGTSLRITTDPATGHVAGVLEW